MIPTIIKLFTLTTIRCLHNIIITCNFEKKKHFQSYYIIIIVLLDVVTIYYYDDVACVWSHHRRHLPTTRANNLLKCAYIMTYKLLPDTLDRILPIHTSFLELFLIQTSVYYDNTRGCIRHYVTLRVCESKNIVATAIVYIYYIVNRTVFLSFNKYYGTNVINNNN